MPSEPSTSATATDGQRLNLKPDASGSSFVDGAWWPESRDLAAELPSIVDELAGRVGPVERVAYNLDAWKATPRKIRISGSMVRMGGFHSQDFDTVDMIGARRRLTLLVVPPETDERTAHDVLTAAGEVGNTNSVEALLHPEAQGEPARTS